MTPPPLLWHNMPRALVGLRWLRCSWSWRIIAGDPLSKRGRRRSSDPHVALLPLWFLQCVRVVPLQCTSLDDERCRGISAVGGGRVEQQNSTLTFKQAWNQTARELLFNQTTIFTFHNRPDSRYFTAFRIPIKPFFLFVVLLLLLDHKAPPSGIFTAVHLLLLSHWTVFTSTALKEKPSNRLFLGPTARCSAWRCSY